MTQVKTKLKSKPALKRPVKKKPLVIKHDGETMNVDDELLQMFVELAPGNLAEIMADLEGERKEHAVMLADELKTELTRLPDGKRAEAISHCSLWIETNANGNAGTMRNILGIPYEGKAEPNDLIGESLIADALRAAGEAETLSRRDDLIRGAIRHLARLKNPLAIGRWKRHFQQFGISADELKALLRNVETDDDGDPIRRLITLAVEASEPEAALRNLFEALASLNAFELPKYRKEVMERLELSAVLFDRMATQSRRTRSGAEVIDGILYYRGDALCNFAAVITHQLTLHDGQSSPSVKYTIEVKLNDGRVMTTIEIDAEEFENVRGWMPRHFGAEVISYVPPAQMYLIATSIKELSRGKMKRETVHTYTGWATVSGQRAFLTTSGAITKDGLDPNVRVDLGKNRLGLYHLPPPPVGEDLEKAILQSFGFLFLAPLKVTAPIWAAMYGAPLLEEFSLNSMLWVYGPTQSGKSTLTMLALTHLGERFIKGRDYFAPNNWVSTVTDIEYGMFVAKDVPFVIDDYAPQSSSDGEKEMRKKADRIVRNLGNRTGRGRQHSGGGERDLNPPRGLVISTAELPLDVQSIVGRAIYVPVERGDILGTKDETGIDEHQRLAGPGNGMYAQAYAGYLKWLIGNWEETITFAKLEHERANQYARGVFPNTQSRMMDYYANLIVYTKVAFRYMVAAGALATGVAQEMSEKKIPAALVELLTAQTIRVAEQSPVVKIFEALEALLITRKAYFEHRLGSTQTPPLNATLIGYWDEPKENKKFEGKPVLYLLSGTCLQLARDYWQRSGSNLNTTKDALHREIMQAGLLAYRDGESYSVAEYVTGLGHTTRLLALDPKLIVEKVGIDVWPGTRTEENEIP